MSVSQIRPPRTKNTLGVSNIVKLPRTQRDSWNGVYGLAAVLAVVLIGLGILAAS